MDARISATRWPNGESPAGNPVETAATGGGASGLVSATAGGGDGSGGVGAVAGCFGVSMFERASFRFDPQPVA